MKTIGMLGGMSWESTATYYRLLNEGVKKRLGGLHSAKILLYSVDFAEVEKLMSAGNWGDAGELLGSAAANLQRGGADYLMICTNTLHKVADIVESRISVPLLHIADATARQIVGDNINKVGLLGTGFTMEQEFYRGRLEKNFGLEVLIPAKTDRTIVHDIIFDELCLGKILSRSRNEYIRIVQDLVQQGAEAIILGCTEISLLLPQDECDVVLYDTTAIHAQCGVDAILSDQDG